MSHSAVLRIVLCVAATVFCPLARAQESLHERIDRLVQPYLDQKVVAGMTIGVLRDGKQELIGYGHLSETDNRTPDGDTIYEIGSLSKVFTGVLLADAVVQEHVKLDQAAGDLLPPGVKMPKQGERDITLRDLSTHVSGLPRLPDNLKPADPNNPYADYTVDDLYAFLNSHKLARPPGERSEYSNLAQGLLGHLLSLEQHVTYEQLLRDRIAAPLKMSDTTITLTAEQRARLAPPHADDGQLSSNWDLPTLAGAGAIRSTARDLLRFAVANIEPPSNELGQALKLAWKVQKKPLVEGEFSQGLGWQVARDGSTRMHNGQTGGYHAMLLVNRKSQLGVALLTNSSTAEVDQLAENIIQMLAGAKVEPRVFEKSIEVKPEVMRRYAGKYELVPGAEFTVAVEDDRLMVKLADQPSLRVYPRSETEWFYKVVQATVKFNIDGDGKCASLELSQNGVRRTAKRIE